MYGNGKIEVGYKLISKGALVDVKNRTQNQRVTDLYSKMANEGLIENKIGKGYFALVEYKQMLEHLQIES